MKESKKGLIGTHWGNYQVETCDNVITKVLPSKFDTNPSPIGKSLYNITDSRFRISKPMIREGYLRNDPKNRNNRGKEPFVPVSWEEALDLTASAIKETKQSFGNAGIYGGSYGWSSAGRFHHAQSQVHRFLNTIGGYTASVNTYSAAAAQVITPHVLGVDIYTASELVKYEDIVTNCDFWIAFGGLNEFNNQVVPGGVMNHRDKDLIERLVREKTEVISISPIRSDVPDIVEAEWITIRPCTDVAIMLGIAHYIEKNSKVDMDFVNRYTVGYKEFKDYLLGKHDGVVKDSVWAESISGIRSTKIKLLAEKLVNSHCPLITVSLSLQRAEHGEQPFWLAIVLAAMLGSIGKSGGGVGLSWGSNGTGFYRKTPFKWGSFPQGQNPISQTIPVARIADMLLNPGKSYAYNGEQRNYPDIELIYWAGGNPFHHHQDLNKLRRAWQKPKTVIVHDSVWTSTARHADIVLPANTFMERNDIVCSREDAFITPSKKVLKNYGQSRSDYEIFCELSKKLNIFDAFSEGRNEMDWLKKIYNDSKDNAENVGITLPCFEEFWMEGEPINLSSQFPKREKNFMTKFRSNPQLYPLPTPSGKIEIFSNTIASFGYSDCHGHPKWYEKYEWLGAERTKKFPFHMISHQPRNKLHSQLDFGSSSLKDKTNGRETVTLNPLDAQSLGIEEGMLVRIFNDRGACLAGAHLSNEIMEGVISLPTGAWYCPNDTDTSSNLDYHGNPNVLTLDKGTSSLAQGTIAHSCLVGIEPFYDSAPEVQKLLQPKIISRFEET